MLYAHLTPLSLYLENEMKWQNDKTHCTKSKSKCGILVSVRVNPWNYWELTTVESVIIKPIWVPFTDRLTGMLFLRLTAVQFGHFMCQSRPLGGGESRAYFLEWFVFKGGEVTINKNCDARTFFQKHSTKRWGISMD